MCGHRRLPDGPDSSIIASATLSVHFDQASTTLLYFSPWVMRPSSVLLLELRHALAVSSTTFPSPG